MKKRLLSLFSAILLLASLSTVASAADIRASAYFGATDVRAYAENNGVILFEIDVDATHTMQEVGASEVYVYEQQSNGDWELVYTFAKTSHSFLIWRNSSCAYVDARYQGTIGKKYFASVACYAKDSSGYEKLMFDTPVVTARR